MPDALPRLALTRPVPTTLLVELSGAWRIGTMTPAPLLVRRELAAQRTDRLDVDARRVEAWDSTLVAFVARLAAIATAANVAFDRSGLPTGVRRMLALAEATPAREALSPEPAHRSRLERVGDVLLGRRAGALRMLAWIGDLSIAFARLFTGRAKFRRSDLVAQLHIAGPSALAILLLVNALVGLIMAFSGFVLLRTFAAGLFVADLVGVAMVRDIGALMVAIVVAGRTGSAFAAELGTMRVTEEIDALATFGISPNEYLVLPRLIAVTLVLPLLTVYADLIGVLGGAVVAIGLMDLQPRLYFERVLDVVTIAHVVGGMFKGMIYGFLIGAIGCYEGLHADRTPEAVGKAATSVSVVSIVATMTACGVFAVIFYLLGL
ncbi:MAG: ABC transporter permease [Kofleriaceae bacterium]|nr:ABC transporter permease [Kofleriaceae bacterium]